jgi:hypothetical protein
MKTLLAAILALAAAAPAAAQEMPGTTLLKASDPARIASYLNQLGYRAKLTKDKEGDPKIETGLGGYTVHVYFYGCTDNAACTSLQFQTGITSKSKLSWAQVNGFNKQFRFVQLHLDEEQDPWIFYDLPTGRGGISGDAFELAVSIYEDQINELDRLLDEAAGD